MDGITDADNEAAAKMVRDGRVHVALDHMGSEITIDATVCTETDTCSVHIRGTHTHIQWIEKNGEIVFGEKTEQQEESEEAETPVIHRYTLRQILEYVKQVPAKEISFIREAFSMNIELLEEGIHSKKTTIGPMLLRANDGKIISEDAQDSTADV